MEVDISEPKSKAFNVFLRMLQLGGQLILGYWASRYDGIDGCDYTIPNIVSILAYVLAALNLISVIGIRIADKFPRPFFFIVFIVDLLLAAAIITIQAIKGHSNCAAGKVFREFSLIETGIAVILCFVILVMRLAWEQRYTNAPGNIVWPPLFLAYHWSNSFNVPMLIIGIVTAIVSVTTLLLHLSTFVKTSTLTRKLLIGGWIFGIIALIVLEIIAVIVYLTNQSTSEYIDIHAKKTLAVFIAVNALDILFWIWGFKSLDYEKGDQVRDELFKGRNDPNDRYSNRMINDQSVIVSYDIGTLN